MFKTNLKPLAVSAMMAMSLTVSAGQAKADENGMILKQAAANDPSYCHIKYMAFKIETLRNPNPEFNPSDVIDRYGSCDFDPRAQQEVQKQLQIARDHEVTPNVGGQSND